MKLYLLKLKWSIIPKRNIHHQIVWKLNGREGITRGIGGHIEHIFNSTSHLHWVIICAVHMHSTVHVYSTHRWLLYMRTGLILFSVNQTAKEVTACIVIATIWDKIRLFTFKFWNGSMYDFKMSENQLINKRKLI